MCHIEFLYNKGEITVSLRCKIISVWKQCKQYGLSFILYLKMAEVRSLTQEYRTEHEHSFIPRCFVLDPCNTAKGIKESGKMNGLVQGHSAKPLAQTRKEDQKGGSAWYKVGHSIFGKRGKETERTVSCFWEAFVLRVCQDSQLQQKRRTVVTGSQMAVTGLGAQCDPRRRQEHFPCDELCNGQN